VDLRPRLWSKARKKRTKRKGRKERGVQNKSRKRKKKEGNTSYLQPTSEDATALRPDNRRVKGESKRLLRSETRVVTIRHTYPSQKRAANTRAR